MRRADASSCAIALVLLAGCARQPDVSSIDLIAELPSAERRAAGNVEDAVRGVPAAGDNGAPALFLQAPARVTWSLRIPDAATLNASVGAAPGTGTGATLRVGISDGRHYEGLLTMPVSTVAEGGAVAWHPVAIDLGKYAGWQWSLFYRPSERVWKVIVNADATPGGTIVLRAPRISRER